MQPIFPGGSRALLTHSIRLSFKRLFILLLLLAADPIAANEKCIDSFERIVDSQILKANHPPVSPQELPWVEMTSGSRGDDAEFKVRYYKDHERDVFKIYAHNGRLYDSFGNILNSPKTNGKTHPLMFAMMQNGEIYAYTEAAAKSLGPTTWNHHSSVPGGTAVATTGNWIVEDGILKEIDNSSGHYHAPDATLDFALKRLDEMGIARPMVKFQGNKKPIPRKPSELFDLARHFSNIKSEEERAKTAIRILNSSDETAVERFLGWESRMCHLDKMPYRPEIETRLLELARNPKYQRDAIQTLYLLDNRGWDLFKEISSWRTDPEMKSVDLGDEKLSDAVTRYILSKGERPESIAFATKLLSQEATAKNPALAMNLFHYFKMIPGVEGLNNYNSTIKLLREMAENSSLDEATRKSASSYIRTYLPKEVNGIKKQIRPGDIPKVHAKTKLKLIPAKKDIEYALENTDILFHGVREEGRDRYRVGFVNGRAYEYNGSIMHNTTRTLIYVIGLDGELYVGMPEYGQFHHSSFFAGADVYGGGHITFKDGVITSLNNSSGHYKITREQFNLTVERLKEIGATFSEDFLMKLDPNTKDK